jgi:glycosyltransferase involved in cell wall biosynthesis
MNQRRIIFVNRFFAPDHSATAQILSDLAFSTAKSNYLVTVLTTRGLYDSAGSNLSPSETWNGVEIARVYQPRFGRDVLLGRALDYFLMYLVFACALFQRVRVGDLVIVKTDPPLVSVALLPVVLLKRAKLVNWLQDLYPEIAVAFGMKALVPLLPILMFLRGATLRKAECNVVIGHEMKRRLRDLGAPTKRISVIPNWSFQDDIRPSNRDGNPLRREWGLNGKFVVAYSGNLGRAHEIDTLLGAAEKLRDEVDLVFLFIGGGALSGGLRVEVERRDLQHLFMFKPYQPAAALGASLTLPDIFWVSLRAEMEGLIVPSKFYGNCAAGRPTIFVGDPTGEIGRLIEENQCGLSVSVGESTALAEVILSLKNDRPRLEAMGRNARRASETTLSKAASLAAWERLIADAIGQPGAAPKQKMSK